MKIKERFNSKLIDDYSSINFDDYIFFNFDNFSADFVKDSRFCIKGGIDLQLVTEESLGTDKMYLKKCTTMSDVENFRFHSNHWGDAYDYKEFALWAMEEILPYIDKPTIVCYDDKNYICDILGILIDKEYNSRIKILIGNDVIRLNENVKMRNRTIKTRITENSDLYGFKFSGYGFKTRSMHTALIDLWCFKDKRTCLKYYNGLKDIVDYFEDSDISDNEVDDYNIMYQNDMQSFFESCQENAVAYYEEIDWRHDIESYKGQDVYLDKFNDKYYKIISDHTIDIYG